MGSLDPSSDSALNGFPWDILNFDEQLILADANDPLVPLATTVTTS